MSIVEKAADRLRDSSGRERVGRPRAVEGEGSSGAPAGYKSDAQGNEFARESASDRARLDVGRLRRSGLMPPQAMSNQVEREYQRIKRPLLATLSGQAWNGGMVAENRLMVTSAAKGEGKTFTTFNLALSLAKERDYSVLLVDGDVLKPGISRALGLGDRMGLMDILSGNSTSGSELIVETEMPGLSVLPAGQRCEEMSELLSSHRMRELADELSAEPARIVVFDSPPLLTTAEAQAQALFMSQILMVVKAGATERRALEAAISLVEHPSRPISIILNQSRKAHGDIYAGYYGMYEDDGNGVN